MNIHKSALKFLQTFFDYTMRESILIFFRLNYPSHPSFNPSRPSLKLRGGAGGGVSIKFPEEHILMQAGSHLKL
jgi:hypothetical protein